MTFKYAGAAVLVLVSSAAWSADIRLKPPTSVAVNWTGFYVGGHLGYLQSRVTLADPTAPGVSTSDTAKGFLGGGQVGFNKQFGNWVVGLEADFSMSNADGSTIDRDPTNGDVTRSTNKVAWTSSAAARFGHTFDRALIYAKGGVALTGARLEGADLTAGTATSAKFQKAGWLVGTGLEYALGGPWSVRGDYSYLAFGTKDLTLVDNTGAPGRVTVKQNMHQFKAGVNYRFGAD